MAVRTLGQSFAPSLYLYHQNTTLGWRILRRVRFADGEKKVAQGTMRRVLDAIGNHIGYQFVGPGESRGDVEIPSQRSSASISRSEMEINAAQVFEKDRSRTLGLPDRVRDERAAKGRVSEDRAERVQRKVQVFPHIGAGKRDILRVWPRNAAEPLAAV
jgi:hypothetical protein